jgi:hypothetical protein
LYCGCYFFFGDYCGCYCSHPYKQGIFLALGKEKIKGKNLVIKVWISQRFREVYTVHQANKPALHTLDVKIAGHRKCTYAQHQAVEKQFNVLKLSSNIFI